MAEQVVNIAASESFYQAGNKRVFWNLSGDSVLIDAAFTTVSADFGLISVRDGADTSSIRTEITFNTNTSGTATDFVSDFVNNGTITIVAAGTTTVFTLGTRRQFTTGQTAYLMVAAAADKTALVNAAAALGGGRIPATMTLAFPEGVAGLNIGATAITKAYMGSTEITKAYVGSSELG